MKTALGIICIMIGIVVILQSCVAATGSALAQDENTYGASAVGMIAGLLVFVAGAFAFGLPKVSMIILIIAGLIALIASSNFPDMMIWAFIAFGLAVLGFFAARQDKKKLAASTVPVSQSTNEAPKD